eukprot:TRINITY_DN4569_c0_g1_i16.p1 TRINITY_DN4569_c0_g1~~TRINITY_DN4569_c0_g1_i16.p1  ORF type:complete len:334 (-),score=92.82 TRINITY_DN4569_c0_g1_i16:142-1143(-)
MQYTQLQTAQVHQSQLNTRARAMAESNPQINEGEVKPKIDVNAAKKRREEFNNKLMSTKASTAKKISFGDTSEEAKDKPLLISTDSSNTAEDSKPKISAADAKSKKEEFQKRFQNNTSASGDKLEELKRKYKQDGQAGDGSDYNSDMFGTQKTGFDSKDLEEPAPVHDRYVPHTTMAVNAHKFTFGERRESGLDEFKEHLAELQAKVDTRLEKIKNGETEDAPVISIEEYRRQLKEKAKNKRDLVTTSTGAKVNKNIAEMAERLEETLGNFKEKTDVIIDARDANKEITPIGIASNPEAAQKLLEEQNQAILEGGAGPTGKKGRTIATDVDFD